MPTMISITPTACMNIVGLTASIRCATGLKYFSQLTRMFVNWEKYLSPVAQRMLPVSPTMFMHAVGVIEIIVGMAILLGATRVFGYIAMLWLFAIAANLISAGAYYDIAVRDILLGIGAYSLARISEAKESIVFV